MIDINYVIYKYKVQMTCKNKHNFSFKFLKNLFKKNNFLYPDRNRNI